MWCKDFVFSSQRNKMEKASWMAFFGLLVSLQVLEVKSGWGGYGGQNQSKHFPEEAWDQRCSLGHVRRLAQSPGSSTLPGRSHGSTFLLDGAFSKAGRSSSEFGHQAASHKASDAGQPAVSWATLQQLAPLRAEYIDMKAENTFVISGEAPKAGETQVCEQGAILCG